MKKICFITTGDIKDIATAKRALGLASPLCDLGWKVSIIMQDTPTNRSRVGLECDSRIQALFYPKGKVFYEREIKGELLRKIKPDFVYICAFVFRNILRLPHGCKCLVEHSELSSAIPDQPLWKRRLNLLLEFYSIVYADGLLNASKYLQDIYRKRARRLCRKKLPMLYFPYAYSSKVCYVDDSLRGMRISKDDRWFVFLGSLTENYGAFIMLHAFERLHKDFPNYHLLLLGKGSAFDDVIDYIREHELSSFVHAPGYIAEEDIPKYFSVADAFISPMNNTVQDWARCPSKLYMYLPYGKPIITCKIGEPYYTLGNNGIYFSPAQTESLVDAIKSMGRNDHWSLNLDPLLHEWEHRAEELDRWISRNY